MDAKAVSELTPISFRNVGRCSPVLMCVAVGVTNCVAICEDTTERTPWSPASIAMKNVVDPQQWTTIWTSVEPVISRTVSTAPG